MSKAKAGQPPYPVVADIPERNTLRALEVSAESRRDEIAALDLEIETLREQLASFEAAYNSRLADEHRTLRRIDAIVRHMDRWASLLQRKPGQDLAVRIGKIDARRQREVERTAPPRAASPRAQQDDEASPAPPPRPERDERLKSAYRELARRYHPDLARTEEERIRVSSVMAKINELYRAGDLDRLLALCERAKGAEVDEVGLSVEDRIALLQERIDWFEAVLHNLQDERADMESCPTCELWRSVQQAEAMGRDLVADIKEDLQARIAVSFGDVRAAVSGLEREVSVHNRDRSPTGGLQRQGKQRTDLERIFDPHADKRMVRIGLEQIAIHNISRDGKRLAAWLQQEGPQQPGVLRIVLFAYVTELSPFPLLGLESFEDLATRMEFLARDDSAPMGLEQALVEADDLVEFGVRRASGQVLHVGLRFRSEPLREAVPLALRTRSVRAAFRCVLSVLGEHTTCTRCREKVFAVPLYRTRGLDDLRASVCPLCGTTLSSYWMPRGTDVQAVLNPAFLDYEIISEWSFRLASASVSIQLTPRQVETLRIGDLKHRLVDDVFQRHDVQIKRRHVHLYQQRKRVAERTALEEMDDPQLAVRFTSDAPMGEAEALEILRHRIRNRFQPDHKT